MPGFEEELARLYPFTVLTGTSSRSASTPSGLRGRFFTNPEVDEERWFVNGYARFAA